ncbi:alpha/beta fold hydrolase [Lactococcus lactis]
MFLENHKFEKYISVDGENTSLRLHAFYIDNNSNTTVILQHGYNANSLSLVNEAQIFNHQGYNIMLPDARGVGLSEGSYISFGAVEQNDINEWVKIEKQKVSNVILFGQSMGASTIMLSQKNGATADAIIEDCGYANLRQELKDAIDSIQEVKSLGNNIPFLHWEGFKNGIIDSLNKKYFIPKISVNIDDVMPVNAVTNLNIPKLFIHGENDNLVPIENERILYSNTCYPKKEYLVSGAKHAENYRKNPAEYTRQLTEFEIENGLFHTCINNNLNLLTAINRELNRQSINYKNNHNDISDIYTEELRQLSSLNISNARITDLSGLEHAINLTSLDISSNNLSSGDIKAINSLSRLTTLNLKDTQLSQDQISQLSLSPSLNHLDLSNNHLYDLTALKGSATSCDLGNQIIAEKEQRAPNGSFKYPMKQIKNRDGSTPKISCNNGGVYDESTGTISWKNLPSDVKEVSYSWIGQDGFSGTVKIPISYIKESDDWGISVPAAIKLNNYGSVASVSYRDTYSVFYGTGRVKIVQKDGSDYPDDAKSFVISAQATKFATTEGNKTTWYSLKHENSEPDKSSSLGNLDNSWLRSERNGTLEFNSNSRSEWLSFFVKYQDLIGTGTLHADCSGTISWSATEK